MARDDDSQNSEKDFLDIDLNAPMDDIGDGELGDGAEESLAAPVKPTGEGVLLYDNKRYAVGLNWLVADEEGDNELATKRAKEFRADFYCMRQGVATQQGFGFLRRGHRINQGALAAVAADALVGEWHGVFVADNGWWYIAVHADNIAPEGDVLYASEEEAYNHFVAQNEAYRWPRSYAPESWNIPDCTGEIPLNKIIGESNMPSLKPATLDAIFSGKRNKNMAIGAGVVIIGLIILSLLGQQFLPSLIPTRAVVPTPDVEVSEDIQVPPREPVSLNKSESDSLISPRLAAPSAMMANCLAGFSQISIPLPGWKLSMLRCKETFVEGRWMRVSGSYEAVEPYLTRFPAGVVRNFSDAQTLTATRRVQAPPKPAVGVPSLLERNYAIVTLTKRLAELGEFAVTEVTPAAGPELLRQIEIMQQTGFGQLGGQDKAQIRTLTLDDLPYLSITLSTRTPPNMVLNYFDLPGVIMDDVSMSFDNGTWKFEAKLVLKPDKRLIDANNKARALMLR